MENLFKLFEENTQKEIEEMQQQYDAKANAQKEIWINEAKRKMEKELYRYEAKVKMLEKQLIAKERSKERNLTNGLKEDLVNTVIEECRSYYKNLSEDEYCLLIGKSLINYVKSEKPRIITCPKFFEVTKKTFGGDYQVVEDHSLSDGFILSFTN